jgi:hypothetical protein
MMNQLPASTGWSLVKQGFSYFRSQPMEFCTLFFGYLFFMLVIGLVPLLGQLLAFVLLPLFTLSFMQGCKGIDQGIRVHPRLLLTAFRSPQTPKLLQLGLLYLLAAVIALGLSSLVDGGVFWQVLSGQTELSTKTIEESNMMGAMLCAAVLYIPFLMAFWFAGPLIAWKNMPLFKAIFYSFVSVQRSLRAFAYYGLCWFFVGGIIPTAVSVTIATITGNANLIIVIMMSLSMLLTIILYCSFYPTYKTLFPDVSEASGEDSGNASTISTL